MNGCLVYEDNFDFAIFRGIIYKPNQTKYVSSTHTNSLHIRVQIELQLSKKFYIPSTLLKNLPYTLKYTIDCVLSKMLNHGLVICFTYQAYMYPAPCIKLYEC